MTNHERVWAEIDLECVRHNVAAIRSLVGNRVEVMAVVKANAYGHGMIECSKAALDSGASWLGVATVGEGVTLHKAFPSTSICLFTPPATAEVEAIIEHGITPFVGDLDTAHLFAQTAQRMRAGIRVHLEIDTGMGRSGALPDQAGRLASQMARLPCFALTGLATHFSAAEIDPLLTASQLASFHKARLDVEATGVRLSIVHAANTAALLSYPACRLTAVRPGLLTYGIVPELSQEVDTSAFHAALALKTRIVLIRELPAGSPISYQSTCRLTRASRIATLPVGYGDGYPRELSNKGQVLIEGRRAPITGRVCMDMTMVDVTDIPGAQPSSEVTLIGSQEEDRIGVDEIARHVQTTEHDVTTRLTARVPRIYLKA